MTPHSVIGCAGRLTHATRGEQGPGEVLISYRGGTEALLAWSRKPLPVGTLVLVTARRGPRQYDVEAWSELDLPPPEPIAPNPPND